MAGSAAFFAPAILTAPRSGRPPLTRIRSMERRFYQRTRERAGARALTAIAAPRTHHPETRARSGFPDVRPPAHSIFCRLTRARRAVSSCTVRPPRGAPAHRSIPPSLPAPRRHGGLLPLGSAQVDRLQIRTEFGPDVRAPQRVLDRRLEEAQLVP